MTPVYIDFETFWSATHSLSRMPATEYVMHPETELVSMAMKVGGKSTEVSFGEDQIRRSLAEVDWSSAMAIGHNMSGFDSMILAWRLGIRPKMWGCTAAMARSRYAKTCGVSLKALAKELRVGRKLDLEATNTKGKKLADLSVHELAALEGYNKVDTDLCAAIFKSLAPGFPKKELLHIDLTTRMLVEPGFELDRKLVELALEEERERKQASLVELLKMLKPEAELVAAALEGDPVGPEWVREQLASAPKFAALLQARGVEVPMKPSPTNPAKLTPALAKTDEEFRALERHDDPLVAAAARTRLDVKSTILETRLEAFLRAADACGGKLPVPLRYCGADTTGRWSGEQYNPQNLPRIDPKNPKPSDALRNSLRAPKDHLVVVADLSGIELRVNHYLWQVPSSMELFAADPKADLYVAFAAARYGIAPEAVDKHQRQLAKVAQLGLGFGAGPETFRKVAKLMGGLDLSAQEAADIVDAWRLQYSPIVQGWRAFQEALMPIKQGLERPIDPWGLCVTEREAVRLPSGRRIHYPTLRRERDDSGRFEWWYGQGRHAARIYAGKGVENLVQALARDCIADHAAEVYRLTGLGPVLMVHDELVYIAPQAEAEDLLTAVQQVMRSGVRWWPDLVTWSEGSTGPTYGACK